jgi:hypothetical protein
MRPGATATAVEIASSGSASSTAARYSSECQGREESST